MYKQILVTLDGSPLSETVLPHIEKLAAGTDIRVVLLTLSDSPEPVASASVEQRELLDAVGTLEEITLQATDTRRQGETKEQAQQRVEEELQKYLAEKAGPLWEAGIETKCIVSFGEPAQQIVDYALRQDVDLIAMATHGRSGLARLVFGSVTGRVLESAGRPVLVVRPDHLRE